MAPITGWPVDIISRVYCTNLVSNSDAASISRAAGTDPENPGALNLLPVSGGGADHPQTEAVRVRVVGRVVVQGDVVFAGLGRSRTS